MRTIASVAIRYEGRTYSLPPPSRHHHIIRMIAEENGVGVHGDEEQGFLDSDGAFLNRKQALDVALAAGQVLDPANIRAGRLFSEDLW